MEGLAGLMDPARPVRPDETGTATNLTRRYGRSRSHQRLVASVPHGEWQTTTFIAGVRLSRAAPVVLNGLMIGQALKAYLEQLLAPTSCPGNIVVLDNLAPNKVDGIRHRSNASAPPSWRCRPKAPTQPYFLIEA